MTSPVVGHAQIEVTPQFGDINRPLNQQLERGSRQFEEHGKKSGHRFFTGFRSRLGPSQFQLVGGAIGSGITAGLLRTVAAGAAAVGGIALFKNMITGASDLNESISKSGVVFGKWASGITQFASNSATALGISKQAAIESAATFGNLFVSLKIGQQPAAQMSTTMVKLAGDLASFNNVRPEDAILALRSALVGETEPMRRFGVNMNDATLKAKALALGLKYSGDVLPPNIKAQAAYALILEQTKTAQGDFARTSGGMANQTRIAKAQLIDLSARVGGFVLPIVNSLFRTFTGFLTVLPKIAANLGGPIVTGVQAFIGAFREGDVTSDGFVGRVEKLGVGLRLLLPRILAVGRTVVSWLIPSFRMIGDFLTQSVVPTLKNLGNIFTTIVLPAIKPTAIIVGGALFISFRIFAFLLQNVIGPVLRGVTGFIRQNQTAITALVITVGTAIGVYGAFLLVTKGVTLAQLAFGKALLFVRGVVASVRVGVWLLNVAFRANPIGVIITLVTALAAGLLYLATKTRFFQIVWSAVWGAVKTAFTATFDWIKSHWPLILAILTGPVGLAALAIVKNWVKIRTTFSTVMDAIRTGTRTAIAFVVDKFLAAFEWILRGAARAFGWVPGIGPKLKRAAREFESFRDNVNFALKGINNKYVNVRAAVSVGSTSFRAGMQAEGGITRFASGSENHIAQFAKPGDWRVWAEPETGGEAYIPLGSSKRPRSVQILRTVANQFGFGLIPAAQGLIINAQVPSLNRFTVEISGILERGITALARKFAMASSTRLLNTLGFAQSQVGKPYIWGGVGPLGYDCSGFLSALVNVAQGRNPYTRRFSTGTLPAGLFLPGLGGAFRIGWFTGNPGHTAGTINGVNVESRGGEGVVVGPRARGAASSLFNQRGHLRGFARGGILPGDPPFDLLSSAGFNFWPGLAATLLAIQSGLIRRYDVGGRWPSGTIGINSSGEDEYVSRQRDLGSKQIGPLILNVDARGATDPAAIKAAVQAGGAELMSELTRLLLSKPGVN